MAFRFGSPGCHVALVPSHVLLHGFLERRRNGEFKFKVSYGERNEHDVNQN